ncbi:MAG TPA: YggS family pyridoxal phosphate-dependent enzyme [Anaeromyxobacter sp.]|nr:YggS family pyridoxal phosphate-dependent enzyme [Anaeromyxobacter sp.]
MSVAERLQAVREPLPKSVTLVAVSKGQPAEAVREAYEAGQRDFGENYAQEWRAKTLALPDLTEIRWHFIGGLQTNKAKLLVGRVAYLHTVDRPELARELSRRLTPLRTRLRVFLEVNVAGEASKEGCDPAAAPELAELVRSLPGMELIGLMCIPPAGEDPRPHFRRLRELRDRLGLAELSMGMSGDFRQAIEEGATFVRIGTAIFGPRPSPG